MFLLRQITLRAQASGQPAKGTGSLVDPPGPPTWTPAPNPQSLRRNLKGKQPRGPCPDWRAVARKLYATDKRNLKSGGARGETLRLWAPPPTTFFSLQGLNRLLGWKGLSSNGETRWLPASVVVGPVHHLGQAVYRDSPRVTLGCRILGDHTHRSTSFRGRLG